MNNIEKEEEKLRKIEAALFISARFMSIQELTALTGINPLLLKELLQKLQKRYNKGSIKIINRGEFWKMDVGQEYSEMINIFAGGKSEFTKAEKLTLAVIAYKQPITQATVVKIRGNKAYEHIKRFRDVGLVKTKKSGRTFQLELTEEFYNYFGLRENRKI